MHIYHPFRHYKRLVSRHGILVEILGITHIFWVAYRDLLSVNEKTKDESAELRKNRKFLTKHMTTLKIKQKAVKKAFKKRRRGRLAKRLNKQFDQILNVDFKKIFSGLSKIFIYDETLLFRDVKQLILVYKILGKTNNPEILESLHELINKIYRIQQHTWNITKAHARGFKKFEEQFALVCSKKERRRIRMHTLKLNRVEDRLNSLKKWATRLLSAKTNEEIEEYHAKIHRSLTAFHHEIEILEEMFHAVHVLTYRADILFRMIEHEIAKLEMPELTRKAKACGKKFRLIHKRLETQAKRERNDIKTRVNRLTPPSELLSTG